LALILANTNPGTHTFDNPACGGGTDTVVINEIIQNPAAVGDSDGEWFEVFNPGGSDVDLNGWTIADNDGDSHVVGASVLVPAGGFAVLCLNSDSGTNGGVTCDYQYSGISLSNGADELVLFDGGLNEIDRVEWDNGATFPDPNGASMALRDPALDNNVGANWCEASTPFGDGDNGTPGAANICAATGSCCVDGVCSDDVVEADCAGDYQGDGTTCVDVVCPLPTGACCVNGVCSDDVLEIDCAGEFQGVGTVCADVECPAVEGACCFAGFCKDNVEENMCAADGGTFQGEGSTCDGSGGAGASSTKAGTVTQSVDTGGAGVTNDYYGSGNDDDFGEYGVTTFNFDSSDFGGAVSGIASASLTVTVNDRGFSDGNAVEFFFTTDTVGAGYTFNDALVNGIDPAQYTFAPVSLGVFNIPEMAGRAGGETDTFALDLSGVSADLINSINNGTDFQIIVAATVAAHDITYSGVGNTFDPGDPTLEIVAEGNGGTPVDCGAAPVVSINEIRIDQPGPDNDEYFELFGTPGQSLDGLWYIVIGDTGTNSGIIESATPLTGLAIDGNGFFVAADDTFTLGTADLTGNLNFENSDNVTHLLVAGFMANLGDDLDADDDCVLDVTPWAGQLDLIALIEEDNPPANTECHYGGTTLGPDGTFVPGHSARCPDGDGEWRVLAFDPADGDDTPGAANFCVDPTGACCFTTGVCEVLTADECAAGAGSYLGDDEACEGDSDADGTDGRCGDNCPDDPNKTEPGVCGCGVADDDSDADGVLDCNDGCPFDPNKTEPGICGCGFADVDTDNDGFLDCEEICDNDPNKQDPGVCGCGTPDVDTDADTVLDCNDQCPGEDDTVDENMNSIPDCLEQPETVPTVSTWGLIALALLLLTAAKVTSTRREFA
ncbi:MAG: lamin tail domain-containing protein, partial [Phycisphaerae bacterium]